jgi:hypothetical protein
MADVTLSDVDHVIKTTPMAILVRFNNMSEVWMPRSVVECGEDIQVGETDVVVRDWFAEREGLT